MNSSSYRMTARGFTLIEMMVAMTLSLMLLGGVLSVLYSSKVTYNENERVARLQENMRAGVEIILRDLRGSGFPGCARPLDPSVDFLTTLSSPTVLLWDFSRPVQGFEAGATSWTPALPAPLDTANVVAGNDVIVVRTVRSNARVYRLDTSMATGTADVVIKKDAGEALRTNVPMLISDCVKSTVFSVTGVTNAATTATIAHAVGGGGPGNAQADISAYKAVGTSMATVAPVDTIVYYIAPSAATNLSGQSRGPALWRISATEPETAPGTAQEVIEGVEAMQALYGEDTNGDLLVDAYRAANAVTNWNNVIAVSLAVVVRSPEEINPTTLPAQTFTLLDQTYTSPSDRHARALFTTTVTLRNRTI